MGNRGICLAAANPAFIDRLAKVFARHAVPVLGAAQTADMAVRLCRGLYPDALVTHQYLLSGSGFAAAEALLGQTPALVLCPRGGADYPAPASVRTLYLPFRAGELLSGVEGLREEAGRGWQAARIQAADAQAAAVARAKALLMRLEGLDEPRAHARLQRMAMDCRVKLFEAARRVIAGYEEGGEKRLDELEQEE
jgi:hypothetical protein